MALTLSALQQSSLKSVSDGAVSHQSFPVKGSPYYLINNRRASMHNRTFNSLRDKGLIRFGAPNMRGTAVVLTQAGTDLLQG